MRRLLFLCLTLISTLALAQTYRWIDSTGKTIISDTPPPGTAKKISKAGEAQQEDKGQSFAMNKAAEAHPVVLYTSAGCIAECKQARDILNVRGIPFTEKLLQNREDIDELKALLGDAFVPALKVGKQHVRGVESGAYNNLLDLAGYPKSAPYASKAQGGGSPPRP